MGDAIMSPGNRTNPDTTDAGGHYGWDVITGFYRMYVSAAGWRAGSRSPGCPEARTAGKSHCKKEKKRR